MPRLPSLVSPALASAVDVYDTEIVLKDQPGRAYRVAAVAGTNEGQRPTAAIFDEVAHWRAEDTATPDREIYRAVKPAMLTIPNAGLIGISDSRIGHRLPEESAVSQLLG